ncbi:DUF2254 domain-containing protein [Thiohalomonas denitrificans]|uniref:Uncharacterized membrane protein n=1 Tax=Thiohalomonas denitrificans TaxID=415747 RepID=A0A1G5QVX2_9GAMM|nr:DUF2254 domain-containing protein [Thiohalomonas denitrificans]SCZ65700.1 Uncharacterized membrane protein [Thiohalomonas denitrificans]
MKTRIANVWQELRSSFWFVPVLMALLAAMLSFVTLALDAAPGLLPQATSWFWSGEPQGARDMLTTIAASMITVAGMVFSITVVALTLAANQFGPRLLRNFMRDPGNQVVLGTFIATFLYCLLVLRAVGGANDTVFIPHFSVTVAVALAVASLAVLIYFIHHVSMSLQVENLASGIATELAEGIDNLFPEKLGTALEPNTYSEFSVPEAAGEELKTVVTRHSGYLQAIENENLMATAERHDLLLCVHSIPGEFARDGTVLLVAWPVERCSDEVAEAIAAMFVIGRQRTSTQDVTYPMQQLVSIAVRALSPGINDPLTAVTCIDWIGNGLGHLAERKIPSPFRLDRTGRLRVIAPTLNFAELADVAFNQIRQMGAGHLSVMLRLLESIETNGRRVHRPEDRVALAHHARWIAEQTRRAGHHHRDLEMVELLYERVARSLSGDGGDEEDDVGSSASDRM